ncbi:hypothetical protein ECE18_10730, partial [Acinetobacter baumannii]|nr:hypothetical protein [Acinetobacter baumannii]
MNRLRSTRSRFIKKIPKNKLRGSVDLYKIKLKSAGYRLLYQVKDDVVVVLVLDVDR